MEEVESHRHGKGRRTQKSDEPSAGPPARTELSNAATREEDERRENRNETPGSFVANEGIGDKCPCTVDPKVEQQES